MHINYKKLSLCLLATISSYTLPSQEINTTNVTFANPKTPSARANRKNIPAENHQKKSHKIITDMNYEELLDARDRYKDNKNINGLTKVLELLLKLSTDTNALAQHMIELADVYYQQEFYKKAALIYNEFILFYKGHKDIEYAHFRAIKSLEQLLLPADRDQSRTQEIISLTENYIAQQDFTQYRDQIFVLQKKCHELLFESKKNTCNFYIMYDNIAAAETCIARLRDEWVEILPKAEKDILTLEVALAQKMNNPELIEKKEQLLASKFPSQTTIITKSSPRKTMRDRF